MEKMTERKRVSMEEFPGYLESQLLLRYSGGLQGLKDRFQTLMTIFKDILQHTLEVIAIVGQAKQPEAASLLESIVQVLNLVLQEYLHVNGGSQGDQRVLLDHTYVSGFLATIQDRVEYVYA